LVQRQYPANIKPWRIGERAAPSTRAYISVVRKIYNSKNEVLQAIFKETKADFIRMRGLDPSAELSLLDAQQFNILLMERVQRSTVFLPTTPKQEILEIIGQPIVKKAVLNTEKDLRRAGASNQVLLRLIPAASQTKYDINTIDLFEAGVGRDELRSWASEGVSLIQKTSINKSWFEEELIGFVRDGMRWESLADRLGHALDPLRSRYELIARDQVAKLNGRITQSMNLKAGVTEFIWRTVGDQRVRERHRELNGKKFSWIDGAPNSGFYHTNSFPGQAGQCRCVAQPVAPDWWEKL